MRRVATGREPAHHFVVHGYGFGKRLIASELFLRGWLPTGQHETEWNRQVDSSRRSSASGEVAFLNMSRRFDDLIERSSPPRLHRSYFSTSRRRISRASQAARAEALRRGRFAR